ncbi:MAG: mRNA interferase MazF [Cyclobacteriaceae bacterium]|jgi:mRNA interferase MazF
MKQGEIWELYLNSVEGSEQSGRKSAVILSGNMMNTYLNVVIVCPLTTKIKNYKGNVVLNPNKENNLKQTSEVLTFHVRSVSKIRLKKLIGVISIDDLKTLKQGLNDILRY